MFSLEQFDLQFRRRCVASVKSNWAKEGSGPQLRASLIYISRNTITREASTLDRGLGRFRSIVHVSLLQIRERAPGFCVGRKNSSRMGYVDNTENGNLEWFI